jgi:hypothetical protein
MASDEKVFDVAKPGSSKPNTGSKPMVVGHKIMKDPTLVEDKQTEVHEKTEAISQASKITVEPVSEEFTGVKNKIINEHEVESGDKSETSKQSIPETENNVEESAAAEPEQTPEEKKENADSLEIEREENLQKIIKEKTYIVPVQEASFSAFKTFLKTFLIVSLLGVLIILILVDLEIIDLGITLPFDIL